MHKVEETSGFGLVKSAQGLAAMGLAMRPLCSTVFSMMPVAWKKFLGGADAVPTFLAHFAHYEGRGSHGGAGAAGAPEGVITIETVLVMAKRTAGGSVDADAPLMEAGVDSLGAVELRNQLQSTSGQALPSTVVFDHPTARQLAIMLKPKEMPSAVNSIRTRN